MATHFLGKSLSGPFTIPSGIVATAAPIMQYIFEQIPEVGVMTTKSIGLEPRAGNREPIMSQYAPGCFVNAVGLTNPGAEATARALESLTVPPDRFLLTSIFGASIDEYVAVAKLLAPYSDGIELNLSCPHAKGYGMAMGQDPQLVREITAAVKAAIDIPVIPKLTPNVPNIGEIAAAAAAGGADAICAINTVGPGLHTAHGHPVLSNTYGGLSGKGVLPIGLKCVKEITAAVNLPVIGCGGISSAADVRQYQAAGATIVGVGSALTGLSSAEMKHYFKVLSDDLDTGQDKAENLVRYDVDMSFRPYRLTTNDRVTNDISILTFDKPIDIRAGEFIFTWIPGLGEKPFSVLNNDPMQLVAIEAGKFTRELIGLKQGSTVYVRGPYGIGVNPAPGSEIIAVAGGTGLAAVYQIARDFGNTRILMGARSSDRLYYRNECESVAEVAIATDDGSEGRHGLVTDLLRDLLESLNPAQRATLVFYNCGPAPMVKAAEAVQTEYCQADQIYSAIDYLTKCGVGICGACHAPDGKRLCVDGPFLVSEG